MLSIAIKNFILIILIILIVHFIIKNHMIEAYQNKKPIKIKSSIMGSKVVPPSFDPIFPIKQEQVKEPFDQDKYKEKKNEELEELYNYVFHKEESNANNTPEIKEFNNEQVRDASDELFQGISGYNSVNAYSDY